MGGAAVRASGWRRGRHFWEDARRPPRLARGPHDADDLPGGLREPSEPLRLWHAPWGVALAAGLEPRPDVPLL